MSHLLLLSIRGLALLAFLLATAGWAGWLVGQVLTDRFGWTQWLHWIPTPVAIILAAIAFVGLRVAWPRRRRPTAIELAAREPEVFATLDRVMAVLRRTLVTATWLMLLTVVVRFAVLEHRLPARPPVDPAGIAVMHWTIGEGSQLPYADIARRIVAADPDVAILTDAPWIGVETDITEWLAAAEHGRRLRFRNFNVLTRLPVREARMLIAHEDFALVRVVLLAPELPDGRLRIGLVNLPSNPRRPRHEIAETALELIASIEVGELDLVIGDFNMQRGSRSMRRIVDALLPPDPPRRPAARHAHAEGGHGYAATWSEQLPLWHIDHAWLGPDVRCTRYDTPFASGHRHYPQIAWIAARDDR